MFSWGMRFVRAGGRLCNILFEHTSWPKKRKGSCSPNLLVSNHRPETASSELLHISSAGHSVVFECTYAPRYLKTEEE